jgi:hypothetical protein
VNRNYRSCKIPLGIGGVLLLVLGFVLGVILIALVANQVSASSVSLLSRPRGFTIEFVPLRAPTESRPNPNYIDPPQATKPQPPNQKGLVAGGSIYAAGIRTPAWIAPRPVPGCF